MHFVFVRIFDIHEWLPPASRVLRMVAVDWFIDLCMYILLHLILVHSLTNILVLVQTFRVTYPKCYFGRDLRAYALQLYGGY